METVQGVDDFLVSHEGKSLSALDRIRLKMHLSCLKLAYNKDSTNQEALNLEEIALSSLSIENFDITVKSLRTTMVVNSESTRNSMKPPSKK